MDPQGEGAVLAIGEGEGRSVVAGATTGWKARAIVIAVDAAERAVHGHQEIFSN